MYQEPAQQKDHHYQVVQHPMLVARLQAQQQAGLLMQNYQLLPSPAPPPVDYARLITEVHKLQAAAQHQAHVHQHVAAQQQALAQIIAYAQMGQAAAAQGFVQPLQQQSQQPPQMQHHSQLQRQWQPNMAHHAPPWQWQPQQQWQPNTTQQTPQINLQLQPQQPWQSGAAQSPPQQYQPDFTPPASEPHHAHQQHGPAHIHHGSSGYNPLGQIVDPLTSQNQQSQIQAASYGDNNNNFAENQDLGNNWFDPHAQPQTPPPQSPGFSSSFGDPSRGNDSLDPASRIYNVIPQTFDPNANASNGDNTGGGFSSDATNILNNVTQAFQPQQSPDFGFT